MAESSAWSFLCSRAPELAPKVLEHLSLAGSSLALAIALGVPLGIWAHRWPRVRGAVLGVTGVVQTVPSLALLALLLPLFGIGGRTAIVALTLYALLPIVRNTLTSLQEISPSVIEAATGLGFSRAQRLRLVELPLAVPVIVAGIRTAGVITIGIATLSTYIGAGGLGDFINRGLAMSNLRLTMLGAISAAILALLLDGGLGLIEAWLRPGRRPRALAWQCGSYLLGLALAAGALALARLPLPPAADTVATIRVGSKNFTEQFILGEIIAQHLEREGGFRVERVFNLGGTIICHQALANGEIDLYPEYTGTALLNVLKIPIPQDRANIPGIVDAAYRQRFACRWLVPLGFDNTYVLAVRGADARARDWRSISDLAPDAAGLRAGFTSEFVERPDGYPGLRERYGIAFGTIRDFGPELMYEAIGRGELDVVCAFSTDGRIQEYGLAILEDDLRFFPPYEAAIAVREATLEKHPDLGPALLRLARQLDDATMRRLNHQADIGGKRPREIAAEFLRQVIGKR